MQNYILCKYGYGIKLNHDDDDINLDKIKKDLTFVEKDSNFNKYRKKKKIILCYWTSKNYLYVPRFYGQQNIQKLTFDYPNSIQHNIKSFKGELRDYQKNIVNKILEVLPDTMGGMINMGTGTGKTVTSLYLIHKIKSKTIIIVHTIQLLEQWQERIKQFLPEAKIGIIQGKRFEIDVDITIAMLQTLTINYFLYNWNTFETFECAIIDECQHISAKKFSLILHKLQTKYRFGLTATPRKDVFQKVIDYHIGPSLVSYYHNLYVPKIQIYSLNINIPIPKNWKGELVYSRFINELSYSEIRNQIISDKVINIQKDFNHERKIIIFTHRIKQIEILHKLLKNYNSGILIGSMKQYEREHTLNYKSIIITTYSLAKEGMDVPGLDTLVIAAPIGGHCVQVSGNKSYGDIEQVVGRILRKQNKFEPLVLDFYDQFLWPIRRQFKQRKYFYTAKRYPFEFV